MTAKKDKTIPVGAKKPGFPLLWFALAAFLLFGQAIPYQYTYLDDHTLILEHMEKLKMPGSVIKAFTEDVFHLTSGSTYYYRPVLTLSFIVDAMAGGGSFAMFHVSNIIYHILATWLLFLFFVKTGFDRGRAFIFGMIFLVHPVTVQAVAWVPGRNDSLVAIFVIASFLGWLRYAGSGKTLHALLHLLFYLLALFTKEIALILPLVILLYSAVAKPMKLKGYHFPAMGWVVISAAWMYIRHQVLTGAGNLTVTEQLLSMVKNFPAVLPFMGKAMFPFHLMVFPVLADMKVSLVLGIVALAVLAILAFMSRPGARPVFLFGIAWFVLFLIPSFITLNSRIPNFSEHRLYLPMAGILIALMASKPLQGQLTGRPYQLLAAGGVIVLFSILTFLHTRNFSDRFTFWESAVKSSPSHAFNYNNLGAMYYLEGDYAKAEPLFRKALEINPYEPMAHSNTGLVCMNRGRPAEAETFYLEEIRINPSYEHSYYNLGLLYFNHSRYDEGIAQWEKLLKINPGNADACKALLFAYEKLERRDDYLRISHQAVEKGIVLGK